MEENVSCRGRGSHKSPGTARRQHLKRQKQTQGCRALSRGPRVALRAFMQGIRCAFVKAHAGSCMEHRLWGPERRLLQLSGALAREGRALNGSAGYSDIRQQPPPLL